MSWSSRHSECVECGEVERPHYGRGLCVSCYNHAKRANCLPEKRWGLDSDYCRNCGTNEFPHQALDLCKHCYEMKYYEENKNNLLYMLRIKYKSMKRTTKRKNFNEIMTFEEFYDFARNSETLVELMKVYYHSNYDRKLVPSVDRIDNNKGYIKGNIQFITHSENSSKGQIDAPRGERIKLVKENRELTFRSQRHAARFLNVSPPTISSVIKNNKKLQNWNIIPIEAT